MESTMRIEEAINKAFNYAREKVPPNKTGNLRYNSLLIRPIGVDIVQIYINQDIAPYAPYTIEKWVSPKWNGKQNPNEGWWDRFCEVFMNELARIMGRRFN